jgi:hypothetical protein
VYPVAQYEEALQRLTKGEHLGKIVLQHDGVK